MCNRMGVSVGLGLGLECGRGGAKSIGGGTALYRKQFSFHFHLLIK